MPSNIVDGKSCAFFFQIVRIAGIIDNGLSARERMWVTFDFVYFKLCEHFGTEKYRICIVVVLVCVFFFWKNKSVIICLIENDFRLEYEYKKLKLARSFLQFCWF